MPALLQEPGKLWTFSDPLDPWGSKERLSLEELERMVSEAECLALRFGPGCEEADERKEGAA